MPTVFDVDKLKEEIELKKEESLKSEVYTNPSLSSKINKDIKVMENKCEGILKLTAQVKDIKDYIDMCELEDDESLVVDINKTLDVLDVAVFELYIATLLSGEYDNNNAIVKIHSGAGGTEACDWAGMLERMYEMFSEKLGFRYSVIDKIDGDDC